MTQFWCALVQPEIFQPADVLHALSSVKSGLNKTLGNGVLWLIEFGVTRTPFLCNTQGRISADIDALKYHLQIIGSFSH